MLFADRAICAVYCSTSDLAFRVPRIMLWGFLEATSNESPFRVGIAAAMAMQKWSEVSGAVWQRQVIIFKKKQLPPRSPEYDQACPLVRCRL